MLPDDPLAFIKRCLQERKVRWTYHISMRVTGRGLEREEILGSAASLEVIEEYPDDKYLPSYLLLGKAGARAVHLLIAVDVPGDNVRIVTAYTPDPREWADSFKRRRPR